MPQICRGVGGDGDECSRNSSYHVLYGTILHQLKGFKLFLDRQICNLIVMNTNQRQLLFFQLLFLHTFLYFLTLIIQTSETFCLEFTY